MRTTPVVLFALSILIFSRAGQPASHAAEQLFGPQLVASGPEPVEIVQVYVPGWLSHGHRVLQMPPTTLPTTDAEGFPVLAPDVPESFHRYDAFFVEP